MGLGIGQLGELTLIKRKHDISFQLQHNAVVKKDLAHDMQQVTKNYQAALKKKTLKWSSNQGVSYSDVSYNVLMRPNECNAKSPILVTNNAGKIVIDEKYKKYAEMISPNGSAGGKYEGDTKYKILESLTGVSEDKLKNYVTTSDNVQKAADLVNEALAARDKIDIKSQTLDSENFIKRFLNPSALGCSGHEVCWNAECKNVDTYVNILKNAIINKNYFTSEQENEFAKACDSVGQHIKNKGSKVSIDDFISSVVGAFRTNLGNPEKIHIMSDDKGNGLQSSYDSANEAYKNALKNYNNALNENGQVFTAEEKTLVEYYDQLFTSIVDNGWYYNESVNDPEYLNQMLQNNEYYITTYEKNACYDPDEPDCIRNYDHTYSTDIASNFDKIYAVSDSNASEEALADYEYEKSLISEKEARIDTKNKNLETELETCNKQLESLDKMEKDNIENAFGLWA